MNENCESKFLRIVPYMANIYKDIKKDTRLIKSEKKTAKLILEKIDETFLVTRVASILLSYTEISNMTGLGCQTSKTHVNKLKKLGYIVTDKPEDYSNYRFCASLSYKININHNAVKFHNFSEDDFIMEE